MDSLGKLFALAGAVRGWEDLIKVYRLVAASPNLGHKPQIPSYAEARRNVYCMSTGMYLLTTKTKQYKS